MKIRPTQEGRFEEIDACSRETGKRERERAGNMEDCERCGGDEKLVERGKRSCERMEETNRFILSATSQARRDSFVCYLDREKILCVGNV